MTIYILVILFITGLVIGSFLNVLIDRLPEGESIMGRSYCDHCKKQLRWVDLFPILSFVFLKGKTSCCRKKLSWQYPLVELLTAVVFIISWIYFIGFSSDVLFSEIAIYIGWTGILCALIVIFFSDIKYRIIPDEMTASIIIFSFLISTVREDMARHFVAGVLLFFIMYLLFHITKKRGLGFGDVKLAFSIGFLLGFLPGLLALYISFLMGGVASIFLVFLKRKNIKSTIAFGPFIIFGMIVMIFYGDIIEKFFRRIF